MTCTERVHAWTNPNPSGERCVCQAIYAPKRAQDVRLHAKKGEKFELPDGWIVTFPDDGFWQVVQMPDDHGGGGKAGLLILRVG